MDGLLGVILGEAIGEREKLSAHLVAIASGVEGKFSLQLTT